MHYQMKFTQFQRDYFRITGMGDEFYNRFQKQRKKSASKIEQQFNKEKYETLRRVMINEHLVRRQAKEIMRFQQLSQDTYQNEYHNSLKKDLKQVIQSRQPPYLLLKQCYQLFAEDQRRCESQKKVILRDTYNDNFKFYSESYLPYLSECYTTICVQQYRMFDLLKNHEKLIIVSMERTEFKQLVQQQSEFIRQFCRVICRDSFKADNKALIKCLQKFFYEFRNKQYQMLVQAYNQYKWRTELAQQKVLNYEKNYWKEFFKKRQESKNRKNSYFQRNSLK